jgi:dihydropyrimidinase
LDVVRWFRSRGIVKVYTETCPHYLTLTDEEMKKHGTLAKVAPPLRYQKDVDAYWQALNEGLIDVVATDYAGRVKSKKEPIWKDVFIAPHGLPDLEAMLPVLYEEGVNQGRIPLPLLVKVTSEMPARIFGIYPPKGALECGFDADLVLFDPSAPHAITAASRVTKVDYSIYEGRKGLGAPVLTMRRGKVLAQMNELAAAPGEARFIPGEPNLALYNQR